MANRLEPPAGADPDSVWLLRAPSGGSPSLIWDTIVARWSGDDWECVRDGWHRSAESLALAGYTVDDVHGLAEAMRAVGDRTVAMVRDEQGWDVRLLGGAAGRHPTSALAAAVEAVGAWPAAVD